MKSHWISRGILAVAAATMFLAASPDAFASKEKFVRDKPHVSAAEEDEAKTRKKAEKKAKQRKQKAAATESKKSGKKKSKAKVDPDNLNDDLRDVLPDN